MKTIEKINVQVKADLPSKNRVGDFFTSSTSATSETWPQVPELHQEIKTTDTTTASGICCFLSKDPIGISGGLNQYVFCGNNPVNFVDPLGLMMGVNNNYSGGGSATGWPGASGDVSSAQAAAVAQSVNSALCDLGQPQFPGNVYPSQSDFAGVANSGFASGWDSSISWHGTSWESSVLPGSPYAVKYYDDFTRGPVATLTPATGSLLHYWQGVRFYVLNENVNYEHALDFLLNRNNPFWEFNVFPHSDDENCK